MPSKQLIVNADDYGLCREISLGILDAHATGIVTAVSVVSVGSYFKDGSIDLKNSGVDVGLHLTFVGNEKALTGPIKGLTDAKGRFLGDKNQVIPRIALNSYDRAALEKELYAQAQCLADVGFVITHIDAHQHLHLLPGVTKIVVGIVKRFNIPWIRIPQSKVWDVKGSGLNILGHRLRRIASQLGLRTTDHSLGFDHSGHIDSDILMGMLDDLMPGTSELIMHPGLDASHLYDWGFNWQHELAALKSNAVKEKIEMLGIQLTNYSDIP
jgi:predicted glycoside hydrolase/deacetylase ChbG (UPF0249 family)